jgi:hypothetical protein
MSNNTPLLDQRPRDARPGPDEELRDMDAVRVIAMRQPLLAGQPSRENCPPCKQPCRQSAVAPGGCHCTSHG